MIEHSSHISYILRIKLEKCIENNDLKLSSIDSILGIF